MTWAKEVSAYLPQLRKIAKDGVTLYLQPFDYDCAVAVGVERDKSRQGIKVLRSEGVPSKSRILRALENWGWCRRKVRSVPPTEAAARIARWLREAGHAHPQSKTGAFDWEYIMGDEGDLNEQTPCR